MPRKTVLPGQASRIFTGAPIPKGANAVVMQEDAKVHPSTVSIHTAAVLGENIRFSGEDVRAGDTVLRQGQVLEAGTLGLMASLGLNRAKVIPRPRVGVLVNGDEIVPAGKRLRPGQIYNSNSVMLAALVRRCDAEVIALGVAGDRRKALRSKIQEAMRRCDALVTVGGVSVGKYDLVKPVLEELGAKLKFWQVAMKPGKPLVFGTLGHLPVFGLPGNPVSAFVTFLLLVRPAILKLRGLTTPLPSLEAAMGEALSNPGDRRHFLRVRVNHGIVRSAGRQGSHVLSSLAAANGLLDLAAGERVRKGQRVQVEMVV
jgi:molybdopterin molybdotransferase